MSGGGSGRVMSSGGGGPGPPRNPRHGLIDAFQKALLGHDELEFPVPVGFTTGLLLSLHDVTLEGIAETGLTRNLVCRKHPRHPDAVYVCSACAQVVCCACHTSPVKCCSPTGGTYRPQTDQDWALAPDAGVLTAVDYQHRMAMLTWHIVHSRPLGADATRVLDGAIEDVRLAAETGHTTACLQYAKILNHTGGDINEIVRYMCIASECQPYALTCVVKWLRDTGNTALYQKALGWGTILE